MSLYVHHHYIFIITIIKIQSNKLAVRTRAFNPEARFQMPAEERFFSSAMLVVAPFQVLDLPAPRDHRFPFPVPTCYSLPFQKLCH